MLMTHLYSYFGALLGCSDMGSKKFPPYKGDTSMYEVHKFMSLDAYEVQYFIEQVGLAAASFGVAEADVMFVGSALQKYFGYKCSPETMVLPKTKKELQSICIDVSLPSLDTFHIDADRSWRTTVHKHRMRLAMHTTRQRSRRRRRAPHLHLAQDLQARAPALRRQDLRIKVQLRRSMSLLLVLWLCWSVGCCCWRRMESKLEGVEIRYVVHNNTIIALAYGLRVPCSAVF